MLNVTCSIVGCDKPVESQGLCSQHFTRALIYGQVRIPGEGRRHAAQPQPAPAQD